MTTSINAVGFDFSEDQMDFINKKLERIKFADDLIVDLMLKVKEDKKFVFDTNQNSFVVNKYSPSPWVLAGADLFLFIMFCTR